jgi:hypothetical protein
MKNIYSGLEKQKISENIFILGQKYKNTTNEQ